MKKEDTPKRPVERLVFRTMSGIRVLSPDRIIYVGYIEEEHSGKCMQLAYQSLHRDRVHVEQLCYRSLRSLRLPDSGPIMQIHRRLYLNIDFVEGIDKQMRLTLSVDLEMKCIKVGRSFRKAFVKALGAWVS